MLLVGMVLLACGGTAHFTLLRDPARAPPDVREGCARTEVRCASCHTLERILTGESRNESQWREQIERMRLLPSSGISPADADVILHCLTYRDSLPAEP